MGLTSEIGDFLAAAEHTPPASVWPTVRMGFADCLGVMIAGWDEPGPALLRRAFLGRDDLDWPEVLAAAAPPDAGLLLGAAAHVLDFDDTGLDGHPSAVLLPAVLAEGLGAGADGRAMASAFIAGYEVWAELVAREADAHHAKGWHPSAVLGTVAAAAASAVLRGQDAPTAVRSLSLAASMAGGVVANFGTMAKAFQLGRAIQSGLTATRLAEAGLTAAGDALEHPLGLMRALSPKGALDVDTPSAIGRRWRIAEQGLNIKLYPVCYAAHRLIDAMDAIRRQAAFEADEVAGVEVELGGTQAVMLREHRPINALQAKFSAEFAVAAMAVAGRCGLAELTDGFVGRPEVQAVMPKVTVRVVDGANEVEPTLGPADRARVELKDGRMLDSGPIDLPRGHFRRPAPSEADLRQKFVACAAPRYGEAEADRQFAAIMSADRLPDAAVLYSRTTALRGAA